MPPAAAVAVAAVDPSLEAAFQASCEAVAGLSITVLDEKQPELDWHRWMQALMDLRACTHMYDERTRPSLAPAPSLPM